MTIPIRLIALAAASLTLAGCATARPHNGPDGYGPSRYSDRGDCGGCGGYDQGGGYGYEYGQGYGHEQGYGYPSGPGPAPWQQNTALRPHHAEGGYVGYGYGYAPAVSTYSSSYSSSGGYAYGSAYGGDYGGYPARPTRYCEQHRIYDWHDGH